MPHQGIPSRPGVGAQGLFFLFAEVYAMRARMSIDNAHQWFKPTGCHCCLMSVLSASWQLLLDAMPTTMNGASGVHTDYDRLVGRKGDTREKKLLA